MTCKCKRCEYEWVPRTKGKPKVCPRCKSYFWDTPKKIKKAKEEPCENKVLNDIL